jgi:hypothetical protein
MVPVIGPSKEVGLEVNAKKIKYMLLLVTKTQDMV